MDLIFANVIESLSNVNAVGRKLIGKDDPRFGSAPRVLDVQGKLTLLLRDSAFPKSEAE